MNVYTPKITNKNEVIGYLSKWSLESGYKYVPITNNGNGLENFFWKIWHEQKNNPDSELRKCFPNGNIWKNPKDNSWRFYFNNNQEKPMEKIKEKQVTCNGGNPNCKEFQNYQYWLDHPDQAEDLGLIQLNDPCGCCLCRRN